MNKKYAREKFLKKKGLLKPLNVSVPYADGIFLLHVGFYKAMRLVGHGRWENAGVGRQVCGICGSGDDEGVLIRTAGRPPIYFSLCRRCWNSVLRKGGPAVRIIYNAVETSRR